MVVAMDKETLLNIALSVIELDDVSCNVNGIDLRICHVSEEIIQQFELLSTHDEDSDAVNGLLISSDIINDDNENQQIERKRNYVDGLNTLAALFNAPFVEITADGPNLVWRSTSTWGHILPIVLFVKKDSKCVCVSMNNDDAKNLLPLRRYLLYAEQNICVYSQTFNLIIYQILDIFSEFAKRSLFPILSVDVIHADENLWLTIDLPYLFEQQRGYLVTEKCVRINETATKSERNETRLRDITEEWCSKRLSNFDYLLKLNEFAGRDREHSDNHYIMPWVCDFSSKEGGWRDLSRTKYRLNKGDQQLKEMFNREPFHHIAELLSDIGYMVYSARTQSKQDLCRIVRANWVPEEYPRSVARIYEWTPDECIPEFYSDPSLFHSIHPDMCDLELPSWCDDANDFIEWHRSMLESDYVSSNLHQWIDLVFGYKLCGTYAVDELNVHLSSVQKSHIPRTSGIVQLFNVPHPKRRLNSSEGNIIVNVLDSPKYNPLYRALNSSRLVDEPADNGGTLHLSDIFRDVQQSAQKQNKQQNDSVLSIAVTILELTLSKYCRDLSPTAAFEDRLSRAKRLILSYGYLVPGHIREPLKLILRNDPCEWRLEKSVYISNWLLNTFNLPSKIMHIHSHLVDFHNLAYRRMLLPRDEKNGDLLNEQVESLIECMRINEHDLRYNLSSLFIKLLSDPTIAIAVLTNAFVYLIFYFDSNDFNDILLPVINNIYHDEAFYPSVLKLLDRRFLIQLSIAIGTESFMQSIVPSLVQLLSSDRVCRSEIVCESIVWLSKRYGPIITARHISSTLLKMLAVCYSVKTLGEISIEEINLDINIDGDKSCSNVIACLLEIAVLYGVSFITDQYLPYCCEIIQQTIKRINCSNECASIAAVLLLQNCCNYLSDKQLMDYLQEQIIDSFLHPSVNLFCSAAVQFSSISMRRLFVSRLISTIHLLSCRIGYENVMRYLSCTIQQIFSTFDLFYEIIDENIKCKDIERSQLSELFSISFAELLIRLFSSVCGHAFTIDSSKSKSISVIITKLCDKQYSLLPRTTFAISSGNKLSTLINNIDVNMPSQSISNFDPSSDLSLNDKMTHSSSSQMNANCSAHYRAILSLSSAQLIPFNQLSIASFNEHSSAIRRLAVMPNENCFASASFDKTIKLWSIKYNQLRGQRSQWTYRQHTRPILDLCLLPSINLIASTDSSLHIWDPFRGSIVSQFDWPLVGDSAITNIATLDRSVVITSAPIDNSLRLIDVRAGRFCYRLYASESIHTLKCLAHNSSNSTIRCFAISPNQKYCAVALSNGVLSIVDIRSGCVKSISMHIHSDTIEMRWMSNELLVSTHLDHAPIIWDVKRLKIKKRLPDLSPSMIVTCNDQLFCLQPSGRIKLFSVNINSGNAADSSDINHNVDNNNCVELTLETKLKSDLISGSLSYVSFLANNKMFLFGSSIGNISLLC